MDTLRASANVPHGAPESAGKFRSSSRLASVDSSSAQERSTFSALQALVVGGLPTEGDSRAEHPFQPEVSPSGSVMVAADLEEQHIKRRGVGRTL